MGKLIGVFATDIASRVQSKIYQKLHEEFKTKGYNLVFFAAELNRIDFQTTDESAFHLLDIAERMEFSAFFLHVESLQNPDLIKAIIDMGKRRDIPVFLYDCENYGYSKEDGVITINPDYKQGFEESVKHLVEYHGCKNVYMLAGVEGNSYSQERIDVYKKVMGAHGLDCSDDKVFYGGFWEVPATEAVNKLIDDCTAKNLPVPEAICCANDSMAISTVKVLEKRGYHVPEDILVTGFDGIEDGKFCFPAISTCAPILDDVPKFVFDVMKKGIRCGEYMVPLRFIPKESCGCSNSFKQGDTLEMSSVMESVRQNVWQHSMLSNLQLSLLSSCNLYELYGGMYSTVQKFKGLGLVYCIREDLEYQGDFTQPFDRAMVRLNFDFYDHDEPNWFLTKDIIPEYEEKIMNAKSDELFAFQILHSSKDQFGYSLIRATRYVSNEVRIFSQFAESFTNMLESVLRNIRLEQATAKLNEMYKKMSEIYIKDVMTGLYNRTGYYNELSDYLKRDDIKDGYIHVVSIDMDGLKQINDTYGHQEGDFAIQMVAKSINDCFAQPCICARFGGDEFVVSLFTKNEDEPTAEQISARMNNYIRSLPLLQFKPYSVGVSVGHSAVRISEMDEIKLLEKLADERMYVDKRKRKKL